MKYFYPADILLPKKDFEKWAVIACDQYTSDPAYWKDVENIVGDCPSALHIMLPEIYIEKDNSARISKINKTMQNYLEDDVFAVYKDSMIYVERTIGEKVRKGLVGVIDLEDYDYHKGSRTLVRTTEETIENRLPARIEVRKDAALEMPHVLLLFDDPTYSVFNLIEAKKDSLETAYDFDLMKNGGHIHGWFLSEELIGEIQNTLGSLMDDEDHLLFVVGDGNHSLAAAKECYNLTKNPASRYALVEIENAYDDSIGFESIYRVLFNVDGQDFLKQFEEYTEREGKEEIQNFEFYSADNSGTLQVKSTAKLPVGTLQSFINTYVKEHPEVEVDYIHGEEVVKSLSKKENTLGFIYKGLGKDELFAAVQADGSLPRKTFSMGHADEKRFYIETRKIQS